MKIGLATLVTLLVLAWAILPGRGEDLSPTVLAKGLFSYQAPAGWNVQDTNFSKYPVATGAQQNGFTPNINVVIEKYPKSLPDYVTASLQALKTSPVFQNLKIVDQQPFSTSGGLEGVRVVVTDTFGKSDLQQTFYFLDGGSDSKLVITASCLIADGAKDALLFDASLKSFSLE